MSGTHLKTIDLGELSAFDDLPTPVWIGRALHYLSSNSAGSLVLLSAECPHQGGTVSWRGDRYECPKHGWCDGSGRCTTAPNKRLTETPTRVEVGHVLVDVRDIPTLTKVFDGRSRRIYRSVFTLTRVSNSGGGISQWGPIPGYLGRPSLVPGFSIHRQRCRLATLRRMR